MLKENLTMLRGINGYSQEEIAERIGISRQAYAKWESGATIPDVEKCRRLAEVYGVTVDALLKTEFIRELWQLKNSKEVFEKTSPHEQSYILR